MDWSGWRHRPGRPLCAIEFQRHGLAWNNVTATVPWLHSAGVFGPSSPSVPRRPSRRSPGAAPASASSISCP